MDAIVTSPTGAPTNLASTSAPAIPKSHAEAHTGRTTAVHELAHCPEAAGAARRFTRATLGAWGVDEDTTEQALLVVSELVTNAVEHALPPVALHLDHHAAGSALRIEVDDGGPAPRDGTWTSSCTPDEHGRGSGIVARLAVTHGRRREDHCVTYWADL
ncbi:ATP-binding protein [Kitasatospora sp. RG8]|uniref:ATP-binding protein n=1 Tax=Kitasatospora sp. RG8 TaxID=2820815 RepID=UPI001AE08C93|nr:ATP-binding protein [Kitasatospora sp. RG8]MBP0455704.1 ATP-binding protein [Kitasatospora sp. RG8]